MRQFGVFAKYPEPGRSKTRLAKSIGPVAASHIARTMLERILERFGDVADERALIFTPVDAGEPFRQIVGDGWLLEPQGEGDLGERMQGYFTRAFERGVRDVVVIGADSPTLPRAFVKQAFAELDHAPVVLGPSDDGGYYLVGARKMVPPIFMGVDWGSDRVWRQTTDLLATARIPFSLLPPWYDVDHMADLPRLRADLSYESASPAERALLRAIEPFCTDGAPSPRPGSGNG